jgi:hypothetical protein
MKTMLLVPLLMAACSGGDTGSSDKGSSDKGSDSTPPTDDTGDGAGLPDVPNLIFQSGFEPDTEHVFAEDTTAPCTDDLWGEDSSVEEKGHWEDDLEGGTFGEGHFCFGGGDRSQRQVNLVPDPEDPDNQVLHMQIIEPGENVHDDDEIACNGEADGSRKARIQHTLLNNPNLSRVDYRTRLRVGDAFQAMVDAPFAIDWMTIGEFWNNQSAEADSFRVTLNLVKPESKAGVPFYFGIKADKQLDGESTWSLVWEEEIVSNVVVPIEQWFTIEVSITEGDATTGRTTMHVTTEDGTRHQVADVTGWTRSPDGVADGFKDINTMKIYTSGAVMCALKDEGKTLDIWWDDYAIGGL